MSSRPSVVIVGGGIGGLFAANALIAQGFRVSVYPGQNSASQTPPKPTVTNPRSLVLAEITLPPTNKGAPNRAYDAVNREFQPK